MTRNVILYGHLPPELPQTLQQEYGAAVILNLPGIQRGITNSLRHWDYDVAVVERGAEKAELIVEAVRSRDIPVVEVTAAGGTGAIVRALVERMGWTERQRTAFVVVTTAKGGVGKSTTTAALAIALAREQGQRVLAVDDNPNQANLCHFMLPDTDGFRVMPVAAIKEAAQYLPDYITPVEEGLDLLAPEDYASQGGLTLGVARRFWAAVAQLDYDYVLVDTTPAFATPENAEDFVEAPLTFALIREQAAPTLFVVPFTPVAWGHAGLETTRSCLGTYGKLDWMVPVVTAIDADMVMDNVPGWALELRREGRLFAIPHNRGIRDNPKAAQLEKRFLRDPLKPYRPLAQGIFRLAAARRQEV